MTESNEESDLSGVNDFPVISLYRIAKHAYLRVPANTNVILGIIMSTIVVDKPTVKDIEKRPIDELRNWLGAIRACTNFVDPGVLMYMGFVEDMLEEALEKTDVL